MQVHRIRLSKDQRLQPWEPSTNRNRTAADSFPHRKLPLLPDNVSRALVNVNPTSELDQPLTLTNCS
jgi:hypothetical protein